MVKKNKATLQSIAKACDISVSAAALAFNNPRKLSKAIREKILEEAIRQGYFEERRQKINRITLVFNSFRNFYMGEYYHDVVYGLFNTLMQKNILVQILDSFEVSYSDIHESAGIIFCGKIPETWISRAQEYKIPFVLCGHPSNREDLFSVYPDFENGYTMLLDYLLSCGHRNIGLITGETDPDDQLKKIIINTYKKILKQNKIIPNDSYVIQADYGNMHSAAIAFNKLVSLKPKITAIVCADDVFAYVCLREAKRTKIKVPNQISITGFDATPLPWFLETPQYFLTSVWVDTQKIGSQAVELLVEKIQNPNMKAQAKIIPVKLLSRYSVQRLNEKHKN